MKKTYYLEDVYQEEVVGSKSSIKKEKKGKEIMKELRKLEKELTVNQMNQVLKTENKESREKMIAAFLKQNGSKVSLEKLSTKKEMNKKVKEISIQFFYGCLTALGFILLYLFPEYVIKIGLCLVVLYFVVIAITVVFREYVFPIFEALIEVIFDKFYFFMGLSMILGSFVYMYNLGVL